MSRIPLKFDNKFVALQGSFFSLDVKLKEFFKQMLFTDLSLQKLVYMELVI